jgi:uncharacterized protein YraI
MTRHRTHTVKAALLGLAVLLIPVLAQAAEGFATANVNMRSGPSTRYPAVTVIPFGTSVEIHGCLADLPWCDVSFYDGRGWVAGRYVQAVYRQSRVYLEPDYYDDLGIPFVTFEIGTYWDRYYRNRNFYRDRDYYRGDRDYYRRDTDGSRYQRDRRIRRDYNEFDRARRNNNDDFVSGRNRNRDQDRVDRRRNDNDRQLRNEREIRRDRDRQRIERGDRNRERQRQERRDNRQWNFGRQDGANNDGGRDGSNNDGHLNELRRRCRPGDNLCD